ncbi:7-cyano-7-deazaguanine synthase QueC [Desulfococcus multivorans]|uniref:7-cyano-7-deazaguanine synthase QueC n=1 Tax=Desulfococcus multivorans TaxID=897 RepID=UPI0008A6D5C8|nr:7-cyano-7-deazaguanine synthase QueC [Desulfococcus multivorans]AOY60547.1 QueC: queuosine biosynthesis protein [Desulfococcus multivorans]AQV02640.1 7-cyano-7-deazaguanine synthase QueC [Desulfococcus multivorans]SKA24846.1 preQ(0) biosynthesis protein QueC [Desulfococcus multivorans DSM 2059]
METPRKAIVLSSGGLDSTTVMAIAKSEGYDIYSLSFSYGQRHSAELDAANRVADTIGVKKHLVINVDMRLIGGSALTDDIAVPKDRNESDMAGEIPVTYVPARNTIFLSYALGWAEVVGASDIFIGVNAVDYSGYPDCRPEFIAAFEALANLATKAGVEGHKIRIRSPLIHLTKAEIIRKGTKLGVDYSLTLSCYDPSPEGKACGRCDSCLLRKKGFLAAGVDDPTAYMAS